MSRRVLLGAGLAALALILGLVFAQYLQAPFARALVSGWLGCA